MDYVEISNSMIVYLLCGITVAIAFVQAVLYIRMAKKMTVKANIPATVPKTAFRVGLISAIGPALGVFIVMVGLMKMVYIRMDVFQAFLHLPIQMHSYKHR